MKSSTYNMKFYSINEEFLSPRMKILKDFFSNDISENICMQKNDIDISNVTLYITDKEFYFFDFFNKTDEEISSKIQFHNTLKSTTKNEFDIYHRYEYGYNKFKILKTLIDNCSHCEITSIDDVGHTLTIYTKYPKEVEDTFIF